MQQVKFFTGLEGATDELAEEINTWIRDSGVKILHISGNIAPQSFGNAGIGVERTAPGLSLGRPPSDIFVIILYSAQ
jgi:hypothetical protein